MAVEEKTSGHLIVSNVDVAVDDSPLDVACGGCRTDRISGVLPVDTFSINTKTGHRHLNAAKPSEVKGKEDSRLRLRL
jgi:hypothetical protein